MFRSVAIATSALLVAGCAGAGGPVSGSTPQTTSISVGGDARTGSGSTIMVTSNREMRGSNHRVEALIDEVWRQIPAVYQELEIPVATVNSSTRTIGNSQFTVSRRMANAAVSRYLSCGIGPAGQPLADQYRVDLSLLTILHPETDGTTRVETRLTATATSRGTSGAPLACGSTGRLEALIAQRLALRVTL